MKFNKLLLIIPLLVSCGNNPSTTTGEPTSNTGTTSTTSGGVDDGKTIQLVNANSKLIGTPKADPIAPGQFMPMVDDNILMGNLPTYRHKDKGEVPYVEVGELASAMKTSFSAVLNPEMSVENKTDGYRLYSKDKKGEFIFDDQKDVIKLKNGQAFATPILVENNGIVGDYTNYRGHTIKDSEKTKVYKNDGSAAPEYDEFDFAKYHFDIVKQDDKCYVPFDAFTKILLRDIGLDLAFNGKDFYSTATNSSFLASRVYSSNGQFQGLSDVYYPSKNKGTGEAYRFEQPTKMRKEGKEELVDCTRFLVLQDGGRAYCVVCEGKELDQSKAIAGDTESGYSYNWRKEENLLKINVIGETGVLGTYQVHLDETRFLSGSISKELSEYNYDVLRFIFDTSYGLKDIKGYTDATAFFKAAGVDEGLKSKVPGEYNTAFSKLIGYIDDGHSGFNQMTQHSAPTDLDKAMTYKKDSMSGPRLTKLASDSKKYNEAKMAKYKELYPEEQNPADLNYYQGIKLSSNKETAVISFNGFANNKDSISNMKDLYPGTDEYLTEEDLIRNTRSNFIASTCNGFTTAFKTIDFINKNEKKIKNVVIDLTTNGGGEIATMPYISAFFSDDPTYTIKDVTNGVTREYHYKVDINGDGVFGGEGDTYKGKFNFYFLTSAFSFSCGNCLPGIGKDSGAKIIGEKSGGGTSPVGTYFDALGTYFNLSNHYNMSYKVNNAYTQNDGGIELDYSYPYENGNWYDPNAIQTFINTLK